MMKSGRVRGLLNLVTVSLMFVLAALSAKAQQTTGVPCSPSATTTVDGKYVPPPAPGFGGTINLSATESKPCWPPKIVPPKGAPNVLLIMTDDQGYGITSTFGGVIPTPAMDRLAKAGLRYTQFHSTALCSPTRAALITGRNHHSVGFGVIAEQATGYPGYDSIIDKNSATVGEILRENGYATSWFGKNHNTPTYLYSLAGPFDQWPSGMGFDYFYGFMGGETDQWTPFLFRDHTPVFPETGKPGYNLTTDLADEAIKYLTELNAAAPAQPFLLYYVPGGTHAPHQPTPEWIKKISDMHLFDKGWNDLREQIFANQKKLQAPVMVNGIAQKPIEGISMKYTWDTANANAPSTRTTQYFEMFGNRAIYHDGWIAATPPPQPPWLMGTAKMPEVLNGYKWELYNIANDYSENNDLAAKYPDKLKELQELFLVEAQKYQVFPLDNSILARILAPRPSAVAGRTEFTYSGEMSGLPEGNAPNIIGKSFSITAEVEIPQGGAEGMLNTLGGRFGGYGFYMVKGKPVFTYNLLAVERFRWEGQEALTADKHTIVFDFKYEGPGMAKGGTGVLSVDGKEVARKAIPHTIPALMTIDESFDVGVDTRTGVDDNDYQPPFRFTGKLVKLTINLKPEPMSADDQKRWNETARQVNLAAQ